MRIEMDMSASKQALSDGNMELHRRTCVDPCLISRFECLDGSIYLRMEGEMPRQDRQRQRFMGNNRFSVQVSFGFLDVEV
jgi:hypothetical protein